MSDSSAIDWKQYSLVGALVAATMVLLGFIAHALGIIEIRLAGTDDDSTTPIGGASPSDITTRAPTEPGSNPEATEPVPAADGTWVAVYENELLFVDSFFEDGTFFSGAEACRSIGFDLDTADGFFDAETAWVGASPDHVDLIWDPCTDYGNGVYLASSKTSVGSLWDEDNFFDAATCHADVEQFPLALHKLIDPESPSEALIREGLVLCMRTSDEQIVIGELISVEPSTDASPGIQVTFELTLWANE